MTGLPQNTRYVYVKPRRPPDGYYTVYVQYRRESVMWFGFRPRDNVAELYAFHSSRRFLGPISMGSLSQIILDTDRAVEVFERASSIVADRAVEIFGQPPRHAGYGGTSPGTFFIRLHSILNFSSPPSEIFVTARLYNLLDARGRRLLHHRSIELQLTGYRLAEGWQDLVAQLGKDLAEIFGEPTLKPRAGGEWVTGWAEIWSEEATYRAEGG